VDTLTHALSGALAARVAAPNTERIVTTRECVVLGALVAAFPDSDVVLSALSPLAYLYHHRGVTHSVLLLPLWALLLAGCWSLARRNRAGFSVYLWICAIGLGVHIAGDLITSFGTMIYAPLSDARIEWGTTFIIDLWFSAIIIAALLFAWLFRASRIPALFGLVLLCGYVGLQWLQKERAIAFGVAYATSVGMEGAKVSALPRPVSPFNWMVIVTDRDRYHYAFVNLRRRERLNTTADPGLIARLDAQYEPLAEARWQSQTRFGVGDARVLAEEAWRRPEFAFFRWFAAYPIFAAIEHRNPSVCVWFRDLRFLTPGREAWPFRYGVCREDGGDWSAYAYPPDEQPRRIEKQSP
jgi:inner membrane protein